MPGVESYAVKQWTVAANSVLSLDLVGEYISCLESNLTQFKIGVEHESPQFMQQGLTILMTQGEQFRSFQIDNTENGSALTVRLAWGTGRLRDARLSLSGAINISKASIFDTVADDSIAATSAEEILPANANRREAFISNLSASVDLRIGDSNVGAARGLELKAGQSIILETTEAIYAYNPDAGAVSVGLAYTED